MILIFADFCFFVLATTAHVLWCRCQKKAGIRSISFIVINLISLLILNGLFSHYLHWLDSRGEPSDLLRMRVPLTALILYLLAVPTYLIFYHSLFIESPSRVLLDYVRQRKKATYEELLKLIEDRKFVETRLKTLVETGCVKWQDPFYYLLPAGKNAQWLYRSYQQLLNKDKGG